MKTAALLAAVLFWLIQPVAYADEFDREIKLDIAPQPLASALLLFADQSNIQVVTSNDDLARYRTPGLNGRYTIRAALTALLDSTGLAFREVGKGTISIGRSAPVAQSSINSNTLHLAQAETPAPEAKDPSPGSADAADKKKNDDDVNEIIVTAQKRQENLQDVPISISVLDGEELDKSRGEGLLDSLRTVPGVSLQGGATGQMQIAIRGVAAGSAVVTGGTPVAYYIDSVPFAFARNALIPDVNPFDLARVEVLRGPQGTLYGASALNGVVRVLTHEVDTDEFDIKARSALSATKGGGELNKRGDVAVNIPITPGVFGMRAVVGRQELGGWIDTNFSTDANNATIDNARIKFLLQPSDRFSIEASAWRQSTRRDMADLADAQGNHPSSVPEQVDADFDTYSVNLNYDFGGATLTSSSSYLEAHLQSAIDLSTVAPALTFSVISDYPIDVFSQELSLRSDDIGDWRWSLGAMYRDEEEHFYQNRRNNITGQMPAAGYLAPRDYITASQSRAVFGEVTRLFMDGRLELAGGLRYFEDDVSSDEVSRSNNAPAALLVHSRSSFDALTPRVVATWHRSEDLTFYASYSQGFRSGFDQLADIIFSSPNFGPVEEDTLANYEIGGKGRAWDGRLAYEAALYYMDWRDVQQSLPTVVGNPAVSLLGIINAGNATGPGIDLAMTLEPVEALRVGFTASWNDLAYQGRTVLPSGVIYSDTGDRLNNSPEYTLGLFADYVAPFSGALDGRFSIAANYTSEQILRNQNGTAPFDGDPLLIGRASFSLEGRQHWALTLFAENVNNEDGAMLPDANLAFRPRIRPRTVGLQLEYRFGKK